MQNQDSIEVSVEVINKSLKRTRKKSSYRKINNEIRQKLVEMVYLKDFLLKDAAMILNINYSTAKTILRIFRIEKRISKKNTPDFNCLKEIKPDKLKKFQIIRNKKNELTDKTLSELACESISHSTFLTNSNNINNSNANNSLETQQQFLIKNIQEAFPSLISEVNILNAQNYAHENAKANLCLANDNLNLERNSPQTNLLGDQIYYNCVNMMGGTNLFSNADNFINYNNNLNHNKNSINTSVIDQKNNLIIYENFSQSIQNLASMVGVCYENLKFNQNMINLILNHVRKGC